DQGGGGDEADGQSLLTCRQAEAERHMGLACATGTKGDDVLAPLDPFAARQLQHLHLVELRNGGEVEAVEAFDDRELGRLDAAFDLASIPFDHLPLGKPGEVSDMIDVFCGT